MSSSASSTTAPPSHDTTTSSTTTSDQSTPSNHQPLPLPEPPAAGEDGTAARQLEVGGEGFKLDHLGPLVVHQDGTMSRIGNWAEMSELERENTLRIIGKRNQLRLKKLREEGKSTAEGAGEGEANKQQ
ncbi:hypothetical protein PG993_007297 [Apiospora rasikravindrae]|uniref:Fungal specific transcription factor n=1 Tax=Apiospora rasikravindrae TaxID=990691 RepID=A0ABR1SYH6_9PEZI